MRPRIAIPIPTSFDPEYNERSWPSYASAVERSGGEPVPIPLDQPPAVTARLIATCAGVVLPGSGADVNPQKYGAEPDPRSAPPDPARENVDELLLQDAHNLHKPLLAICFGVQMLNVWRGGTLVQDLPEGTVNHKPGRTVLDAHTVDIAPESQLGRLVARDKSLISNNLYNDSVNSSHHQALDLPGDGLRVVARSTVDGVIEAVEGGQGTNPDDAFLIGVQWHPERTYDHSPTSKALFDRFVSEAAAWAPKPAMSAAG